MRCASLRDLDSRNETKVFENPRIEITARDRNSKGFQTLVVGPSIKITEISWWMITTKIEKSKEKMPTQWLSDQALLLLC